MNVARLIPIVVAAVVSDCTTPIGLAQTLVGDQFTYSITGGAVGDTTGTATVGPGVEISFEVNKFEGGRGTYRVDVDQNAMTVTPLLANNDE